MQLRPAIPQSNPPLSPKLTLPTMYDLPSEDPEEPGLPDEFHDLQPNLLSRTLRLVDYATDQIFTGTDLNLYYDSRHPLWHKRPDWFLVLNVPRLYENTDLRSSYVVWQEGVSPFVVVELLSPGTEKEDLGAQSASESEQNPEASRASTETAISNGTILTNESAIKAVLPSKWQVYEQILRVPYYLVFSRYTNQVRFFQLVGGHYQEQRLDAENPRAWMPELKLGLGRWQGEFEGITRQWLRWYDEQGNWTLTDVEHERQLKQQAEAQLCQVAVNLLQSGMSVEQVAQITGLSDVQVRHLARPSVS